MEKLQEKKKSESQGLREPLLDMFIKVRKVDKVVLFWVDQEVLYWVKECGCLNENIREKVRNKIVCLKVLHGVNNTESWAKYQKAR